MTHLSSSPVVCEVLVMENEVNTAIFTNAKVIIYYETAKRNYEKMIVICPFFPCLFSLALLARVGLSRKMALNTIKNNRETLVLASPHFDSDEWFVVLFYISWRDWHQVAHGQLII